MFRKLKAFSLIEILIALALVGILVAVLSPNLGKALPDKKKALFVKAFTQTEIAVSNMRNDTEMYVDIFDPTSVESGGTGEYKKFGLCNTDAPMGRLATTDNQSGNDKFAYFFARELGAPADAEKITTNDGISYNIEFQNGGSVEPDVLAAEITISILGAENENGDRDSEDIGIIHVLNDGTVQCGDDKCNTYMEDRFNLKQKTE